jgi:hypothetical protein
MLIPLEAEVESFHASPAALLPPQSSSLRGHQHRTGFGIQESERRAYAFRQLRSAFCLLPTAYCIQDSGLEEQDLGFRSQNGGLMLFADCLLLSAFCLLPTAFCLLPTAFEEPQPTFDS